MTTTINQKWISATLGLLLVCLSGVMAQKPIEYVDPNIGTAHCRFYTPGAVPFGMAKPAPSTDAHLGNPGGWQAVGYDFRHTSIEGFANFHEFQIGGVVLAPTTGKLQTVPGELDNPSGGYRSSFDKKDELARPGYYSVFLKDYGVKAELTATKRIGLFAELGRKIHSYVGTLLVDVHIYGRSNDVAFNASVICVRDERIFDLSAFSLLIADVEQYIRLIRLRKDIAVKAHAFSGRQGTNNTWQIGTDGCRRRNVFHFQD